MVSSNIGRLAVIRPLAVFIAMWGTEAPWQTSLLLGWFGPRGIASIIIAAIVIKDAGMELNSLVVLVTSVTVGLSVYLHGLTAEPGATAFADWQEQQPSTAGERTDRASD